MKWFGFVCFSLLENRRFTFLEAGGGGMAGSMGGREFSASVLVSFAITGPYEGLFFLLEIVSLRNAIIICKNGLKSIAIYAG